MIILLNCSYRGERSNSNYFLGLLEAMLEEQCERVHLNRIKDADALGEKLQEADALVLGMPLYVDSAPAQVVNFMEKMYENHKGKLENLKVYVVSNLGFYESKQIHIQLEIVKNWCAKMGISYGGGLAIGAGEMLGGLRNVPVDKGPNAQMGEGIKKLAKTISDRKTTEDIYVEPTGFPRGMYKMAAQMSWGKWAKKNKLTKKELYRRMI